MYQKSLKNNGYTLLEIIIVITLLGLMSGLAIPSLSSLYNSFQWANKRDDVLRRIGMLGYSAFQERREFELKDYPSPDSALPLELPDGWQIKAEHPICYKSDGVCLGGKLQLSYGETIILLNLKPPHCRPE